ncbi:MAG: IclR family transcriptional regulator [Treponema sp.]|jgi:DNA-binding IclR family transcriptional regulator|nr:IclR family transcriptional regulator [Treponema sp.]
MVALTPNDKNMVQKTIDILFYLSTNPKGASLSTITKALKFPKTTVYDILKTLMINDFVQYTNARKKIYSIGAEIYIIGTAYLESSDFFRIARPYLTLLADKYEKTTFIAKRHYDRAICVYKYSSPYAKAPSGNIGDRKRFHSTAIGKCYLAFDPEAASMIDSIELVQCTPYTISDREKLKANLSEIKKLGYSWEQRESHIKMACLAAPVFKNDCMAGTISMTGWYREDEDFSTQGNEIAQLAKLISAELNQQKKT